MAKAYTSNQLEVINVNQGYNMVLAGPGCGKTDILAERIARAYEQGHQSLDDMLCLTFTNRAARSMYSRVRNRLGNSSSELFVGNIHRYCSRFLFDNHIVPLETTVMDEEDSNDVINSEVLDDYVTTLLECEVEPSAYGEFYSFNWETVNDMLGIEIRPSGSTGKVKRKKADKIVSQAKLRIMQMEHLMKQVDLSHPRKDFIYGRLLDTPVMRRFFPFFNNFERCCHDIEFNESNYWRLPREKKYLALARKFSTYKIQNNLLDFDDLLIYTYDAYLQDSQKKYKRYSWVQVDEIQDLSNFQISLVDLFTNRDGRFVVLYLGDEQQAIYSFMGASLNTLSDLKARCGLNIYRLDKNFRSPKYLLDVYNDYATKVLNVDRDLLPKPKDNAIAGKYDLCMHIYDSESTETNRIYNAILPFLRDGDREEERTALLVPWNIDANEISDQLRRDNIPHFKISGLDTFQTVHMRLLMAHFNVIYNEFNLIAWSKILKHTYAVDNYSEGRHLVERLRNIAMSPADLLRSDESSYLMDYINAYDEEEIVLFDTETTGIDVFNDDIVQIAAVKIYKGEIVPGSKFNIFLYTDKEIPAMLGRNVNPMVEAYKRAFKYSRRQGLEMFLSYIGDRTLIGHNVKYDYNILKYNLTRELGYNYDSFSRKTFDTLKLAHLLYPRLRKYKLESLLVELGLEGVNSHMADDDIIATLQLANHCRKESDKHLTSQRVFFTTNEYKQAKDELDFSYKESYTHTHEIMYRVNESGKALIDEILYVDKELTEKCEVRRTDRFDLVIDFLREEVITEDEPNALYAHLSNHLMDMSTYREADMCESRNFKEKLFISTVHKAKGLEFENVVVLRAVNNRYPSFAHKNAEEQDEDKRLLYVAISRAMKRLIISGHEGEQNSFTPFMDNVMKPFCLRSELYASDKTRIVIEITYDTIQIKTTKDGITNTTQYGPINRLFDYGTYRNQIELLEEIKCHCSNIQAEDNLKNFLRRYNI